MAGASIILNRFTGPGRLGIQSMTYHPPVAEGATQAGGTSNIGGTLGQLFNNSLARSICNFPVENPRPNVGPEPVGPLNT